MARFFSSGFELNSVTAGVEFTLLSGSPTISTTTVRSGTYAGRSSSLTSGAAKGFLYQFLATAASGAYYTRFAFNYATLPTAANVIHCLQGGTTFANVQAADVCIKLTSTGTLQLFNASAQVGSDSSALSANTWYYIEMKFDRTPAGGSQILEAKLNGSVFATTSTATLNRTVRTAEWGGNLFFEAQTTGDWFFDDIAMNDTTGSFQTGYPGDGKIIHLHPDSQGDANGFTTAVGGTAGAANNFSRVLEVTPDDATTYNAVNTLNAEDLLNCGASGLSGTDTVNVVAVGFRMANITTADATAALKVEIEKTSGGTKSQSGVVIPNSTTWRTNAPAVPQGYPLTTYQDPDGAAWTNTTLNSMQIGYLQSATNTQVVAVSTVWALIDYTTGAAPGTSKGFFF